MAAVVCSEGSELDGKSLAETVYEHLPRNAMPLFVRVFHSPDTPRRSRARRSTVHIGDPLDAFG